MIIDRFDGEYLFLSNFAESPLTESGKIWQKEQKAHDEGRITHTEKTSIQPNTVDWQVVETWGSGSINTGRLA